MYVLCAFLSLTCSAKSFEALHHLLCEKLSNDNLKCFFNNYSTGGLIGFYAFGPTATAVAQLEAAVAELKAVSSNPNIAVDAVKSKVSPILGPCFPCFPCFPEKLF